MLRLCLLAALGASSILAADTSLPRIDKVKLETYLRYIEGYTPGVKLAIDDPAPSAFDGFFRVLVHLSLKDQKIGDRLYYVSSDGQHFISGQLWDLNQNPYLDVLEHLPMDGPSFGPAAAKIKIVVFSDFQCPYCREFAKTLRDNVPKKYPNDVQVIFQNFPIETLHPWAKAAAEAGNCIASQNPSSFWAFHDWIFEHQAEITPGNLAEKTIAFAKDQHLDSAQLSRCLSTRATAAQVEESLTAGRRLQIQQTPTMFINGRMLSGAIAWNSLDPVIQLELNRPKEIPGPPLAKCCEITPPTIVKK